MTSVYLICVGKLKEKFYLQASEEYLKRLGGYCKMTLLELPEEKLPQNPSQGQINAALEKEADNIRSKMPPNATLITMCVEGKPHSSEEVAALVRRFEQSSAQHLVFVIGGSNGLSDAVLARADARLSFSNLTFPHGLMRVILLEQLYRAERIRTGEPYHK